METERPILVRREPNQSATRLDYRKFYPYYSKPRLIPIFKKIVGGFFAGGLVCFLLANFLGMFLDYSKRSVYVEVIKNSVYFLYPFISLFAVYWYLRKREYDSETYSVSIFFNIFVVIYNGFWIWRLINFQSSTVLGESSAFTVWSVFNILAIAITVLIIALQFTLILIRPKVDYERVRKIQKEMQKKAVANLAGKDYEIDWTGLD